MALAATVGFVVMSAGMLAQQTPVDRGAAASVPGQADGRGRGVAVVEVAIRPPLLFREEWKQPPYTGTLDDEKRRVTQEALSNSELEVTLYGTAAYAIGVYSHEGRLDLWSGLAASPTAVTLKDKKNYLDLTGLARLRWIVRTQALHILYPVVKLADGALLAGSRGVSTDGDYIQTEMAFGGTMHWFKLDPGKVVTTGVVENPDLSKVDEIGWVDLAPGGGRGNAGWNNVSTIEVYAKAVPR